MARRKASAVRCTGPERASAARELAAIERLIAAPAADVAAEQLHAAQDTLARIPGCEWRGCPACHRRAEVAAALVRLEIETAFRGPA